MDWKPRQIALGVLAGLAIGLGVDRLGVRAGGAPEDEQTTRPATVAGSGAQSPDAVHRDVPANRPNAAGGLTPAASKSAAEVAARETELRTQIRDLQVSLDKLKAEADPLVVPPLTRPANLPSRFEEKALTRAAMDLVHEINPTAEVTAVDCTEYPCIIHGTGFTVEQAKSIKSAAALRAYSDDHGSVGVANNTFSFWVVPKDDPNSLDAIDQRTSVRIAAMSVPSRPH
jgi:hypothetical protein